MLFKNLIKAKSEKKKKREEVLLSQVHPKYETDIWEVTANTLQQYSFIRSFIPVLKQLDCIMFLPFVFLPVSVLVTSFRVTDP